MVMVEGTINVSSASAIRSVPLVTSGLLIALARSVKSPPIDATRQVVPCFDCMVAPVTALSYGIRILFSFMARLSGSAR